MFAFAAHKPRRRPSLTPMIDVVFLLLVFFMLAARFGQDNAVTLTTGGGGGDWQGAPRLVELRADAILLNGVVTDPARLAEAVRGLLPTPDAPVILRADDKADLSRLTAVLDLLRAGGITNLVLVE